MNKMPDNHSNNYQVLCSVQGYLFDWFWQLKPHGGKIEVFGAAKFWRVIFIVLLPPTALYLHV